MAEPRSYPNDLIRRRVLVALEQAPDGIAVDAIVAAAGLTDADEGQRTLVVQEMAAKRLILVDNPDLRAQRDGTAADGGRPQPRYYHPKHAERMAGG